LSGLTFFSLCDTHWDAVRSISTRLFLSPASLRFVILRCAPNISTSYPVRSPLSILIQHDFPGDSTQTVGHTNFRNNAILRPIQIRPQGPVPNAFHTSFPPSLHLSYRSSFGSGLWVLIPSISRRSHNSNGGIIGHEFRLSRKRTPRKRCHR